MRVINPLDPSVVIESVRKTGALIVVDGGWLVVDYLPRSSLLLLRLLTLVL